jgi:hypothetical protein
LRNGRLDDFVRDIAAAAAAGAACPDMAAPKALPHLRECGQQPIGAFAFHPLDQATARDVRRDRAHDMDMVWCNVPLEDIDAGLLTRFTDNGSDPFCHLTAQPFMAVLGDPDAMEVDGKGRRVSISD